MAVSHLLTIGTIIESGVEEDGCNANNNDRSM